MSDAPDATGSPQRLTPANGYVDDAAAGIALLLWTADPSTPGAAQRLATPFFMAAAAAAMELAVEVYFSAGSVRLLLPGVAESLSGPGLADSADGTVWHAMREAHQQGARFYACGMALKAQGLAREQLRAECAGLGGAVQFMARSADLRWRSLVF
jgi:predicted peroxiredoxin